MSYDLKRFRKAEDLHFITFHCFQRLLFLEALEPKNILETESEWIAKLRGPLIAIKLR